MEWKMLLCKWYTFWMAPWPICCFIAIFYVLRESHFLSGILLILEVQIVWKISAFQSLNGSIEMLKSNFEFPNISIITTAQIHSTKSELRFCAGSNPARGVSEISDGEDLWQWSRLEIMLNSFRRSTIPQKQFIIIKF